MGGVVEDIVEGAIELRDPQGRDLLRVRPNRPDGGDWVILAVYGQGRNRQRRQLGAEAVPGAVKFSGQRPAVGVGERQRVIFDAIQVERVVRQSSNSVTTAP